MQSSQHWARPRPFANLVTTQREGTANIPHFTIKDTEDQKIHHFQGHRLSNSRAGTGSQIHQTPESGSFPGQLVEDVRSLKMIEHRDCFRRSGGGWLGWWESGLAPDLWVYVPPLSFTSSMTLAESPYFSVPPFVNYRMSIVGLQGITGAGFILFFKVKQIPRPRFFFLCVASTSC